MKLNVDGLLGLAVMAGLAGVGITRGDNYYIAIPILIVAYGIAILGNTDSPDLTPASIHVGMLLTLISFFVHLPHEPFISLLVAPLAVFLTHCVAERLAVPYIAPLPAIAVAAIAEYRHWSPLWYPAAALLVYAIVLVRVAADGRGVVGANIAVVFVALGLLVDVSKLKAPSGMHNPHLFPQFVQAAIFIGCEIAGVALPYFVLKE